ncbi:serine protease inhibitor [Actinosynnema sp.]|uniref:serine protease inhibitor n=1 Tax=Actinosynnema sp. TaxID=1872144 RepID=UPI003F836F90
MSRSEWPELVGASADQVVAAIRAEHPGREVVVVPEGSFVTLDYREDRVRVFVTADGRVAEVPRIG